MGHQQQERQRTEPQDAYVKQVNPVHWLLLLLLPVLVSLLCLISAVLCQCRSSRKE
jgi:hypothetical protein